jgi:hypothetical protein
MTLSLDRIDAAPIADNKEFDPEFRQWIWTLIDTLNELIIDVENALNALTANNLALLSETVTLSIGSPSFTVADGTLYNVGNPVIGSGIPANATILSIVANTVTLTANATSNGSSVLTFVPVQSTITNGILFYDTTENKYVGMISGALVQFTTTSYP